MKMKIMWKKIMKKNIISMAKVINENVVEISVIWNNLNRNNEKIVNGSIWGEMAKVNVMCMAEAKCEKK